MILTMQHSYFTQELDLTSSESELIEAAKSGDLAAFNQLVLKYQDMLYRIAYRIFADEENARDAVQDTFIAAFQHLQSFRDGSFKAWLIRIVVNKCHDHVRSSHYRRTISLNAPYANSEENDPESAIQVRDPGLPVEHCLESVELDQAIQASLNALSPNFRSVIVLADIEELDYREISRILKVPVGTVKSRLARARLKLSSLLLQHEGLLPDKYIDKVI